MTAFFEKPILNSPYDEPAQHWELDDADLPTDRIVPRRRSAKLISPIPEQRLRGRQRSFVLDSGHGLSTEAQEFNPTPIIHALRDEVDRAMTRKIDAHLHRDARLNIPPGEMEPFVDEKDRAPLRVEYDRRRPGLDPQLIWRGKGLEDDTLTAVAPPIYLQEQIHPKALIEDLRAGRRQADDLFAHFGLTEGDDEAQVEFYAHPMRWSNRMILGDSLQVMASLAEREGLRGQVQAIYIDPPYGIRFNSNFQWSTTSRDVKDGTGSPSTPPAWRLRWPAPGSWARSSPSTCSPTAPRADARRPTSPARPRRRRLRTTTSARASSTSACRTSR